MNKHFRQFVRLMLRLASNLLESTTNRRVGGRGRWSIRGAGLNVTLLRAAAALALGLEVVALSQAAEGFVQIRNGYLCDPVSGDYFIPRGVAYQLWNPPAGANQSLDQVDYDLLEFKKLRANSVRAELTWGQVQIGPTNWDWTKPDHLIQQAEQLGLKLFIIIGYQYPPAWFPTNWFGINNLGLRADVVQSLAKSTVANALNCLPAATATALQSNNSPTVLTQVMNCLVTGAKAGGVSNILQCLQTTLSQDELNANLPYLVSDVINYEDPQAQAVYTQYIAAVTGRYRTNAAIGAWILGNEYAYFDLWEDPNLYPVHRFLGYDALSQQSFHNYLQSRYQTNIAALNANWQASYSNFASVIMPLEYPADRLFPGYQDLVQWRKQSIGKFVALGAAAARQADPYHLQTYSMIGEIFSGLDANFTCEDAKAIVAACAAAGAPLDFWSINNYGWAQLGSELRSIAFGIGKYQAESGLPVMVSETGYSSTETLFDVDPGTGYSYSAARQPKALPSAMWESLLAGAIGVHFFTWNDRGIFTQGYFPRERGFGIVQINRLLKPAVGGQEVYDNIKAMFVQMENLRLEHLLRGSSNPPPDVQLFWSTNADMVWPRANQENAMIWGALKRLGYQPGIIGDAAFEGGGATNAPVLLLSRCVQMDPLHLARLANNVLPAGVSIHAQAELPGQYDAYCRSNSNWVSLMRTLLGVDVSTASPAFDLGATNDCYVPIHLIGAADLGPITNNFAADLQTWEFWQQVAPVSAQVLLTASGFPDATNVCFPYLDSTPYPALLVNAPGAGQGRTALNPFALGSTFAWSGTEAGQWDTRYAILSAIYRDYFGLQPAVSLSSAGPEHVLPSYRLCANGSVLIGLLNEDTNAASLTISAPSLLAGRKVEDLSAGGVLTTNSTGTLNYTVAGDDCILLYAYATTGAQDNSLINPNPNKLWFADAPLAFWPNGSNCLVNLGYDAQDTNLAVMVTLEQTSPLEKIYGQSSATNITGQGALAVLVPVPDPDANDPNYISSHEGGDYVFRAWLLQAGLPVFQSTVPVRLLFGAHPTQPLPGVVTPGQTYPVTLAWEELPSYLSGNTTPLDRAALWDSLAWGQEHYRIVLELISSNQTVVTNYSCLTSSGTGSNTFSVTVPSDAAGPFTWQAYSETATNVLSDDVFESFEGYALGANWQGLGLPYLTNNLIWPWNSYVYSWPEATFDTSPTNLFLNEGVQLIGSDGSQSAFMVVTNPSWTAYSGFGLTYQFTNGDWALPADHSQWTNYVFSYDFQEANSNFCLVGMQVKSPNTYTQNFMQYTRPYAPGADGWFTVSASLDQFTNAMGAFDPSHVDTLVLNVAMLVTNVLYIGSFDNIWFTGPEVDLGGGVVTTVYTSANQTAGLLSIQPTGPDAVSVSWYPTNGNGILQSAPAMTGPWLDVTNAATPMSVKPSASMQFYRLRPPGLK